jgi:hypothetical protein
MRFRGWLKRLGGSGSQEERGPGREDSVEAEDESGIDPFNPFPSPVRIEIGDVFDLHTIAPRDVKRVVVEYLAEARASGYTSVRIVHGKGIGVQREMVRSILARTPFVEAWTDAPQGAGGWGATIVRLSPEVKKE